MKQYIYPQNLKSQAQPWLWRLKDLVVLGAALLVSVLALSQLRFFLPLALTMVFAFLTMRFDDNSILNYIRRAARYFITTQQFYIWKQR